MPIFTSARMRRAPLAFANGRRRMRPTSYPIDPCGCPDDSRPASSATSWRSRRCWHARRGDRRTTSFAQSLGDRQEVSRPVPVPGSPVRVRHQRTGLGRRLLLLHPRTETRVGRRPRRHAPASRPADGREPQGRAEGGEVVLREESRAVVPRPRRRTVQRRTRTGSCREVGRPVGRRGVRSEVPGRRLRRSAQARTDRRARRATRAARGLRPDRIDPCH